MKQIDVAGAVITNERGEILCALRSARMSLAGHWEFPGGKLEASEEPRACLRREIQEELGCDIEVGELIVDHLHHYPDVIVRLLTYEARLVAGAPHPHEHAEIVWLPIERLRTLRWAPADLPTIEALERRKRA